MIKSKNSLKYWEDRFFSGNWEKIGGRTQTKDYALALIDQCNIDHSFDGTLLDFGCALGDAINVYKEYLPNANFIGLDHSAHAIEKCKNRYGKIAEFIQGNENDVPTVDIIIASHVLEHVTNEFRVVNSLLSKCKELYIVVPYKEDPLWHEHVRSYDETHYLSLGTYQWTIFYTKPYKFNFSRFYHMQIKNILRPLFGKKKVKPKKAILFHFVTSS